MVSRPMWVRLNAVRGMVEIYEGDIASRQPPDDDPVSGYSYIWTMCTPAFRKHTGLRLPIDKFVRFTIHAEIGRRE